MLAGTRDPVADNVPKINIAVLCRWVHAARRAADFPVSTQGGEFSFRFMSHQISSHPDRQIKLYKIREWSAWYENNRSRTVKELSWVPIPNRHDGENYSAVVTHPDGAVIFAAWVLILQVASRCQPRGTLLRDNKQPHTAATLSLKTRAPEVWFKTALEFLENNTDWLEIDDICQPSDATLSPACGKVTMKGREGNGREQNGSEAIARAPETHYPEAEIPSWDEWWTFCQSKDCLLMAEWFARDKFLAAKQDNWRGKANWRAYAVRVQAFWVSDGRPMTPPKKQANGNQKPDWTQKPVGGNF